MKSLAYHPNPRREAGAALMIFVAIFVLGVAAVLLSELNRTDLMLEQQAQTTRALAQAKEALIGYAVTSYDDEPGWYGLLPHPNKDKTKGEGVNAGSFGSKDRSVLRKLPWRSLGLEPLRDSSGECLWYAVSGSYKKGSSSRTDMLNEDTKGWFEVWVDQGTKGNSLLANDVVAVIIAPGELLLDNQPNQNKGRTQVDPEAETMCGDNYTASNYLDETGDIKNFMIQDEEDIKYKNPFITYKFITAQDHLSSVNDRIVYITREELFETIRRRTDFYDNMQCLTLIAAHCLADYATQGKTEITDRRLPWAAPVDLAGEKYSDDDSYRDEEDILKGRLPKKIAHSNTAIGKNSSEELITSECVSTLTPEESQMCDFNGEVFMKLWKNWKDHLFYAVAEAYQPSASATTPDCASNDCLQVGGEFYAGIVIFAGTALEEKDQSRKTEDEKGDKNNYLEEVNATSPDGNGTYKQRLVEEFVDTDGKTKIDIKINDILYCIKDETMEVNLCP